MKYWVGLVVVFCVGCLWFYYLATRTLIAEAVIYKVQPGASIHAIVSDLHQSGVISQPSFFLLLAYGTGTASHLKTGEYCFPKGSNSLTVLRILREGKPLMRYFTIVEGWTFKQLRSALMASPYIVSTLTDDPNTWETLSIKQKSNLDLEGLFFPATYDFTTGTTDVTILNRASKLMEKKLQSAWQQRDPDLVLKTPYQALIMASLVEKETAQEKEKPAIAGVIFNRLIRRIPLQIDSSVIYGLRDRLIRKLSSAQLKINTPYNTYLHYGLPPTPIAIPSLASIQAVLHPQKTNALYFVARGDGTHQFSERLQEHHEATEFYRQIKYPMQDAVSRCIPTDWLWGSQLEIILDRCLK
jgi:UPF0755 protein